MNLSCVICADLLNPSDDVYATLCGHIFHYICLYQWLERSKSCPQCRHKCSEKNAHKIYFNISNLDTSTIDIAGIQQELDDVKLKVIEKDKELKGASEEIESLKASRKKCMKTVSGLERELSEKNFLIFSYDEQLKHLKTDTKALEDMRKEVKELKTKNQLMTTVQDVLTATSSEVESMLKGEQSVETLSILVAALKRELQISEKRKNELRESLKCVQTDLRREQKQKETLNEKISFLESVNYRLKEEAKSLQIRKDERAVNDLEILTQTPKLPIPDAKVNALRSENSKSSPTISERVKIIEESNSPYFNIKSSSIGLSNLLKNSEIIRSKEHSVVEESRGGVLRKTTSDLSEKYSIFKKPRLELQINQVKQISPNLSFNGIGGTEKIDEFPDFTKQRTACEMKMKSSSLSERLKSGKFKRLPRTTSKETLDKFVTKSNI